MDKDAEKKSVQGNISNTMNLEEYKARIKLAGRSLVNQNRANQQNIPVNRVQPMQQQQMTQQNQTKSQADPGHVIQTQEIIQNRINNQHTQEHQEGIEKGNARMLVILASGEHRLITFTLPRDSCTVQELLEQTNVPFDSSTVIQCVSSKGANIDYVVTVGIPLPPPESRAEWIQNAEASLMLNKPTESPQQPTPAQPQQQQPQPAQSSSNTSPNQQNSSSSDTEKFEDIVPSKYIPGFYAVCKGCGACSLDHAKCDRCKRVFVEEPKRYPFGSQKAEKTVQGSHSSHTSHTPHTSHISHNTLGIEKRQFINTDLVPRTSKTFTSLTSGRGRSTTVSVTPRGRGRGGLRSARQAEAPVILTLSSDDEDPEEEKKNVQKAEESNPGPSNNLVPLAIEPILPEGDYDSNIENRLQRILLRQMELDLENFKKIPIKRRIKSILARNLLELEENYIKAKEYNQAIIQKASLNEKQFNDYTRDEIFPKIKTIFFEHLYLLQTEDDIDLGSNQPVYQPALKQLARTSTTTTLPEPLFKTYDYILNPALEYGNFFINLTFDIIKMVDIELIGVEDTKIKIEIESTNSSISEIRFINKTNIINGQRSKEESNEINIIKFASNSVEDQKELDQNSKIYVDLKNDGKILFGLTDEVKSFLEFERSLIFNIVKIKLTLPSKTKMNGFQVKYD